MIRLALAGHGGPMARRSTSQFKIDDSAFPVRVKFKVPERGLGQSQCIHDWLKREFGPRRYAWGPAHTTGVRQATAYYFRTVEDAQAFVAAFPELELADGVASPVYTAPGMATTSRD